MIQINLLCLTIKFWEIIHMTQFLGITHMKYLILWNQTHILKSFITLILLSLNLI
jgi:hypothetical protein